MTHAHIENILQRVQEVFTVTGPKREVACPHIAEALSTTPLWFQNILLNDDIKITTSSDPLVIATARARIKGEKGSHSNIKDTIDYYHYKADDTLWHEAAHRFDFLLVHNRYVPAATFGPASVNTQEWTKAVEDLVSSRNNKNPIYLHLTKNSYKAREYRQEAFAELTTRYVELYKENANSVSERLLVEQPILWPVFEKCFLPKLQEMSHDMAIPLSHYVRNGNWSITSRTELRYGKDAYDCITLDTSDMSKSQKLLFEQKLDRLDGKASINDRVSENGLLYIKRDQCGLLEAMVVEAGNLAVTIPARRLDGKSWQDGSPKKGSGFEERFKL